MKNYEHKEIEKKWQQIWEETSTFKADNNTDKPKYYALIEFPYPSGYGLHVGHLRPYTALDIVARKKRLEGYNVLYPIGWDAFGLPAENSAIKNKVHPSTITEENILRYKKQLKSVGMSFDWSRELSTTSPHYYKWTQWIFLKLFQKGLAYKKEEPINWCNSCKVGLANEEVIHGKCERCGNEVIRKNKSQWMLKITAYAQRLLDDLHTLDFMDKIKVQQRNWIGRSEGAEIEFLVGINEGSQKSIKVFTTRPDTVFGVTYLVLAPEHPIINELASYIINVDEVSSYKESASRKSDFERTELIKDKSGVKLKGLYAINPVNNERISLWISDYVLMSYGTGAIMAVPAHDTRDWEFAKQYNLPKIQVISGGDIDNCNTAIDNGILINSDFLNGMDIKTAKEKILSWLYTNKKGTNKINYKLRDWIFSRQRYWGEPIPLIFCESCGYVPVPENELPVVLPQVESYEPTDNGESPLSKLSAWTDVSCPKCGKMAKRETDTMPQWAGSSWYFLRYIDPNKENALADKEKLDYWLPVDWYNGGMEHTTLHLLYSRFWHKFLYDIHIVSTPEPYKKRTSHGMILGANGEKMSKSRGNVISPDNIVTEFGADALRVYEMFIGDFEKSVPWSEQGLKGCRKFLDRVWKLKEMVNVSENECSEKLIKVINRTIKKVTEDFDNMKYNTAIASIMSLINDFSAAKNITAKDYKTLLILLNPVAPHITEELWYTMGFQGMISEQKWPQYNKTVLDEENVEIILQINGKTKDVIFVAKGIQNEEIKSLVYKTPKIAAFLNGKSVVKEIYVKNKLFNIVVK